VKTRKKEGIGEGIPGIATIRGRYRKKEEGEKRAERVGPTKGGTPSKYY